MWKPRHGLCKVDILQEANKHFSMIQEMRKRFGGEVDYLSKLLGGESLPSGGFRFIGSDLIFDMPSLMPLVKSRRSPRYQRELRTRINAKKGMELIPFPTNLLKGSSRFFLPLNRRRNQYLDSIVKRGGVPLLLSEMLEGE
jgi:hypothetical protein